MIKCKTIKNIAIIIFIYVLANVSSYLYLTNINVSGYNFINVNLDAVEVVDSYRNANNQVRGLLSVYRDDGSIIEFESKNLYYKSGIINIYKKVVANGDILESYSNLYDVSFSKKISIVANGNSLSIFYSDKDEVYKIEQYINYATQTANKIILKNFDNVIRKHKDQYNRIVKILETQDNVINSNTSSIYSYKLDKLSHISVPNSAFTLANFDNPKVAQSNYKVKYMALLNIFLSLLIILIYFKRIIIYIRNRLEKWYV